MPLPFRFNDWWPVFDGPSTGRLILELFGEPEDASTQNVLNFTIRGGNHSSPDWQHKIGVWFGTIGPESRLVSGEKLYAITGSLFSIDDQPLVLGMLHLDVQVRSYSPSLRDRGIASLKVSDSVGYDPFELVYQAARLAAGKEKRSDSKRAPAVGSGSVLGVLRPRRHDRCHGQLPE